MSADFQPPPHSWLRKFARAFWGIGHALRTQSSCHIHGAMTLLVIAAGLFFRVTLGEWCLLALSIGAVWSAELMNTAIERLAKQVDRRHNLELGQALDIASGAVLCMAIGAAAVGLMVFGPYVWAMLR
jgi:diacylglycerol kinase (ATP)